MPKTPESPDALPPVDLESEEALAGALNLDGLQVVAAVAPIVKPEDFYRDTFRWVYEAALALWHRHEAINQVTLTAEVVAHGHMTPGDTMVLLSTASAQVPTTLHATAYATNIHRCAVYRRMIDAAGHIAKLAYAGGPDEHAVIQQAWSLLLGLRDGHKQTITPLATAIDAYLESGPLRVTGPDSDGTGPIPTGYPDMDRLLGGMYPGNLVLLAARPSIGKSALALCIARHAALSGHGVAFFSLEMSRLEIAQRLVAAESGVPLASVRSNSLTPENEAAVLGDSSQTLRALPWHLDDTPALDIVSLRARLQTLMAEWPIRLLVVDYLQLVQSGSRSRSRYEIVTDVAQQFKSLARELDIPVLALSQLNRRTEGRSDHRPELADLRESGALENEADVVMLLHREDFYATEARWHQFHPLEPYPEGIAEVIVAKHRNGPTGDVKLYFRKHLARFESLARQRD